MADKTSFENAFMAYEKRELFKAKVKDAISNIAITPIAALDAVAIAVGAGLVTVSSPIALPAERIMKFVKNNPKLSSAVIFGLPGDSYQL